MKQQNPPVFEGRTACVAIVLLLIVAAGLASAPGLFAESLSGHYVKKDESTENKMYVTRAGNSISMTITASSTDGVMNFVDSIGALTGDTARFDLEDGCLFFIKFQKTAATITTRNCKTIEGVAGIYYTGTYKKGY
jgi:hypothetical protein